MKRIFLLKTKRMSIRKIFLHKKNVSLVGIATTYAIVKEGIYFSPRYIQNIKFKRNLINSF